MMRGWLLFKVLSATALALLALSTLARHELARFPSDECSVFRSWLDARRWRESTLAELVPAHPEDPHLAAPLRWVAGDALRWLGWPPGLKFAAFREHSLEQVLSSPSLQSAGALLLVLPGRGAPRR